MDNETIKIHTCSVNVETKLFLQSSSGKYAVRIRDVDAEENIGLVVFPSYETAEAYFKNVVAENSKLDS